MESIWDDIKNAFKKSNNGNVQLIIINVVVFLAINTLLLFGKLSSGSGIYRSIEEFIFVLPSDFMSFLGRPWTILTYGIAHEGFWHLAGNMLILYYFGVLFIEFMGQRRFVNLYILGVLAGGALYLLAYNLIPFYVARGASSLIGASAGVLAVVIGTATVVPNYAFNLFGIFRIKIKWIALFYAVTSYLGIAGINAGGELAHLGGIVMGWFFVKQTQKGNDIGRWISAIANTFGELFSSKPKMKASRGGRKANETNKSASTAAPSQEQIDVILDKIAKSGYSSLSAEEKRMLFQASNDK